MPRSSWGCGERHKAPHTSHALTAPEDLPTARLHRPTLARERYGAATTKSVPGAPPAAVALSRSGPTWVQKATVPTQVGPRPKATLTPRAEAEEPIGVRLRRLCSHMKDSEMAKLNRSAQKEKHGEGGYRSHTDRYRQDPTYRLRMQSILPTPTPEWLVFRSGEVFRVDGGPGR